mgnify:CR=1 FL=1
MQTPIRNSDGASSSYIRHGSGETLVFVHGVGLHADIWRAQLEAMREQFDVIAMDMLGHGQSSLPPHDAVLGDFSNQLYALINVLELDKVHLAGHSMGAMVILDFVLNNQDRALSLAGLNPVFRRTSEQRRAISDRAATLLEYAPTPIAEATIARWFGSPVPARLAHHAQNVREMLEGVDPTGYARAYRIFASADAVDEDRLRKLVVPCLFMTGEIDPNSTPAMCAALAGLLQDGRCDIIRDERHMMALTAPDEVNAKLAGFFLSLSQTNTSSIVSKDWRP